MMIKVKSVGRMLFSLLPLATILSCSAVQKMMQEIQEHKKMMAERRGPDNSDKQFKFEMLQSRRSQQYFNLNTAMSKSSLLKDCNRETVELLTDISPDWRLANWSARVKSVSTSGNSVKIVLSHKSSGGTFETVYRSDGYIDIQSGDFDDLELIEEGQKVSFSGRVVNQSSPLTGSGRLTFEDSFTETGRMEQPEFVVDFLEVTFRTPKALR